MATSAADVVAGPVNRGVIGAAIFACSALVMVTAVYVVVRLIVWAVR